MASIEIEVDDYSEKFFRELSPDGKEQFSDALNLLLKKAANSASATDYRKQLDEFGTKAIANGLTPEILDELLNQKD